MTLVLLQDLKCWCSGSCLSWASFQEMHHHPQILKAVLDRIVRYNFNSFYFRNSASSFSKFEVQFKIMPKSYQNLKTFINNYNFWNNKSSSIKLIIDIIISGGCPDGVIVKAMDCRVVVREFVLQSCYYFHFRANTLGKGMNPLFLPAMG